MSAPEGRDLKPGDIGGRPAVSPWVLRHAMLIKLTQPLGHLTPDELYEAARGWWRVSSARRAGGASSPRYALAVSDNTVVAAYLIEGWEGPDGDGRWRFHGRPDLTLDGGCLGADVGEYYAPGAQNPLRYLGGPGPAVDPVT